MKSTPHPYDKIPDVRDGLTREERVVLYVLRETQKERGDRNVPTTMLWGRVRTLLHKSRRSIGHARTARRATISMIPP